MEIQNIQEDILSLLRSKSRCLKRMMEAGERFMSTSEETLVQNEKGSNPLALYDAEREGIMNALELYDRKLTEMIHSLPSSQKSGHWLDLARSEILLNETLVISVLDMDDRVMKKITSAQNKIHQMLGDNRKSREATAKFKSSWVSESGDEVDTTL